MSQIRLDHDRISHMHTTQGAINERKSKIAYHSQMVKEYKKELCYFEKRMEDLVNGS